MSLDALVRLGLVFGDNRRDGQTHEEWHFACGCALRPDDPNGNHGGGPHVHPCSKHGSGDHR